MNRYTEFEQLAQTGHDKGHSPQFVRSWGHGGCTVGYVFGEQHQSGCSCGWKGGFKSADDSDAMDEWIEHARKIGVPLPNDI